jgi:hypothetical protein
MIATVHGFQPGVVERRSLQVRCFAILCWAPRVPKAMNQKLFESGAAHRSGGSGLLFGCWQAVAKPAWKGSVTVFIVQAIGAGGCWKWPEDQDADFAC